MKTYSGLDYLKIDIANQFNKDKLLFEDRITWFNKTIADSVVTMNNQELYDYLLTFTDLDNLPLAFTSLLAYKDYYYNRPTGYRVSLDAVCSGGSLMSALMADVKGLDHTGLISNKRGDLYTAVFEKFKQLCDIPVKASRKLFKDLVMQSLYGSTSVIKNVSMELLGYSNGRLAELPEPEKLQVQMVMGLLVEAMNQECNGAYQLQQSMIKNWDSTTTKVEWILPDGFNVVSTNKVDKDYVVNVGNLSIPYKVREESTIERSVENCANSVHSIDGMLVREMQRRCNFNYGKLQEVLWYLNQVPNNLFVLPTKIEDKLDELICLYEASQFCSIRITEYIHTLADACRLSLNHRSKLISIIELLLKQGTFDMITIHDSFTAHPNKMNYVRYWYKELIADIVESNLLVFIHNQFPNKISDPISKQFRQQVANVVRQSNYGLC